MSSGAVALCGDLIIGAIRNVVGVVIAFALARAVSVEKNALPELCCGPWGTFLPLGGWSDRQYWFSCDKCCVLE